MTLYRVQIVHPDGSREYANVWGNGATNAHWNASQLHPDRQISVLGVIEVEDE
jgi:hypothetical protein